MNISIIVAVAKNNIIGKDNKLIWHLPADLKHFKSITSGHYVIMGRKVYESIGKPLPNRTNIVITRQKNYRAEGCIIVDSIDASLILITENSEAFIIGGGEIYQQTIDLVQKIYLTRIDEYFEGDTFFPEIDLAKWNIISEEKYLADEKNKYQYSFLIYERKMNQE
jgi:dihydrofolate reductase